MLLSDYQYDPYCLAKCIYSVWHYADCCRAECCYVSIIMFCIILKCLNTVWHYAKCHHAVKLSIIILLVVLQNVFMPSTIMLSLTILNAAM